MTADQWWTLLSNGTWQSVSMSGMTTLLAYVLGLPLGLDLYHCSPQGLRPQKQIYGLLGTVVNILRSVPFLILMVYITPFTRWIAGSGIGARAAVVPLTVASAPFVARLVETSLLQVPRGVREAAEAMGASKTQILWKVLLPEAGTSILSGAVIAATTILSYSAMAGFIGAGGLGAIALNYGYNRYNTEVMTVTVILLILLVQLIQGIGGRLVERSAARRR